MKPARFALGLAALVAGLLPPPAGANPVADFYKGRTIRVIVGYSPGGGYDVHARALTRHMGKHIPGNPTFVIQNMHGAGSLIAANFLYNLAEKDGTVIGTIGRGAAMEPLIGASKTQFDATKFNWIGSTTNELSVCAVRSDSAVKSFEDLMSKPMAAGGEGGGSDPDTYATLVNRLFGAKINLITGYPGASEMTIAIERGEIDGRCGWSWQTIRPDWIAEKKITVLAQMALERSPALPNVPAIIEKAKTERERDILKLVFTRQVFGRPFLAPPGIPAERLEALRAAFEATVKDPEFLADAKKIGLEIEPVSGTRLEQIVAQLYRTPKDIVDETRALISNRPKE